jgi:two-component system sensor histidine kinase HydH
VSDTGCGIKQEELHDIFEPYFTTKLSGTGLGLSIVHNIVKAHKGRIEVSSKQGKGTVFKVFLPKRIS